MARKLQSDKWLFLATLALVCASVVMVYSASALVALERYQQPYLFVTKQVLWALLGVALMSIVMRVDYRTYRNERLIWTLLAVVGVLLVAVLFSRPVNGARRWFAVGGLGIQPSEMAKIAAILFTAMILERRMHRINEVNYALLPIGVVTSVLVALILPEPDLGTSVSLLLVIGAMVFAAGLSYRYVIGAGLLAIPAVWALIWIAPYRMKRHDGVSRSVGRSARRRVPDHPVVHRHRDRWSVRTRFDGRSAEAVLPARAVYRFHLCGHRRGARPDRDDAHAALLLHHRVARPASRRRKRRTRLAPFSRWA